MKQFSKAWKASKDRAKQRKYRANAPKHVQIELRTAKLSKELAKRYNAKRAPVRVGDTVYVMRGSKAGETGQVSGVHPYKRERVTIQGMDVERRDGQKRPISFHASNLMITDTADDKRRFASTKAASKAASAASKAASKKGPAKKPAAKQPKPKKAETKAETPAKAAEKQPEKQADTTQQNDSAEKPAPEPKAEQAEAAKKPGQESGTE